MSKVVQLLISVTAKAEPMDVDSFQELLVVARSVGAVRPFSLCSFIGKHSVDAKQVCLTEETGNDVVNSENDEVKDGINDTLEMKVTQFVNKLMECFWQLYAARCTSQTVAAVCSGGYRFAIVLITPTFMSYVRRIGTS